MWISSVCMKYLSIHPSIHLVKIIFHCKWGVSRFPLIRFHFSFTGKNSSQFFPISPICKRWTVQKMTRLLDMTLGAGIKSVNPPWFRWTRQLHDFNRFPFYKRDYETPTVNRPTQSHVYYCSWNLHHFCWKLIINTSIIKEFHGFLSYLVSTGVEMRSQSLHLAVEDVMLLHLILHRRQILAKALVVKVVLDSNIKQCTLDNHQKSWDLMWLLLCRLYRKTIIHCFTAKGLSVWTICNSKSNWMSRSLWELINIMFWGE